jgi:hypothetical protein
MFSTMGKGAIFNMSQNVRMYHVWLACWLAGQGCLRFLGKDPGMVFEALIWSFMWRFESFDAWHTSSGILRVDTTSLF